MEKTVIFEMFGELYTTNESNYRERIQNARTLHPMNDFENPKEIMDYYIKFGWANSYDDFIVEV